MLDNATYFWIGGDWVYTPYEVMLTSEESSLPKVRPEYWDVLAVDLGTRPEYPNLRYGRWVSSKDGWQSVKLTEFPKEARMKLLLLGVT